jgi:FimV-like protein
LREALRLERFGREGQTAAIAAMAGLALRRQADGDAEQAREAAAAAVSMFEQYQTLDRQIAAMPNPANGKKFGLTVAAKLHAAQCLIILSRNEEAISLLNEVIDEGDADWQEQARELLKSVPKP